MRNGISQPCSPFVKAPDSSDTYSQLLFKTSVFPTIVRPQKTVAAAPQRALVRFAPLILLAITLVGGGLRIFQIANKSLWLDEAFSVWLGWQPLGQMWGWLLRIDQHPPLYYVLLHFWMYLGDSAGMVRLLSALLGTLTIPVIYLLGRRLLGLRAGLLAAAILALSPFHVRFAQETRMYTLLTLNASLAMLALVCLLTDPHAAGLPFGSQLADVYRSRRISRGTTRRVSAPAPRWLRLEEIRTDLAWLGYILFSAATVLSHNTAILFPLATNLFVCGFILRQRLSRSSPDQNPGVDDAGFASADAGQGIQTRSAGTRPPIALRPPSLRNWLLAQLGVFVLWSPWLPGFISQARGVYAEFWIPEPAIGTVVGTFGAFLSDFLPGSPPWPGIFWAGFALLVVLGSVALRKRPAVGGLLLALIATPFAGELLVSLERPIFYDRTLIWASIPLYLLLAAGLGRLRHRPCVVAGLALLVMANGLSLNQYYVHFEKEQWQEAAAYVARQATAGDLLLFNATWVQLPFDFYYREGNRPLPEHGAPVDLFDRGILEPKMTRADLPRLHGLINGRRRVWLVYSHDWYTDPERLIPAALRQHLHLLEQRQFYGLQIQLYEMPPEFANSK